jgi:S1-C subfamily serine protease
MTKSTFKKFIPVFVSIVATVLLTATVTTAAVAGKKATNTSVLTDEQMAIQAVRSAKPAVVNVIGIVPLKNGAGVETKYGTGFIIDSNGFIVTNKHVIEDVSANYVVELLDGKRFPAKILGTDALNDVALLKIEATNLGVVKIGRSDTLETGQTVFAIGNTLGKYQHTVSRGVVSGVGRSISLSTQTEAKSRLQSLIQTDAAISPGNSGGPLINMQGEVIGMSTIMDTDGNGLGFAVPINTIIESTSQIRANGKVARPYLGITFQTLSPGLKAIRTDVPVDQGAQVLQIFPGGPSAGKLHEGDIVLAVNGEVLGQGKELDTVVQKFQAGNQVNLKILRNGKEDLVSIILGEYKAQ